MDSASVIILTAEDGLGDAVAPSLLAAGGDLTKIHSIVAAAERTDMNRRCRFLRT